MRSPTVISAIKEHLDGLHEATKNTTTLMHDLRQMSKSGQWDNAIVNKITPFLDTALDFYQTKELFTTRPEFHKKIIFSTIVEPQINEALTQIGIALYSEKINEGMSSELAKNQTRMALQAHVDTLPFHQWKSEKIITERDEAHWDESEKIHQIPTTVMNEIVSLSREKTAETLAKTAESEKEEWHFVDKQDIHPLEEEKIASNAVQKDLKDCSKKERDYIDTLKMVPDATGEYKADPQRPSTKELVRLKMEANKANETADPAALEKGLLYQKALHEARIDAKEKTKSLIGLPSIFQQTYTQDKKELIQINCMLNTINPDSHPISDKDKSQWKPDVLKKGSALAQLYEKLPTESKEATFKRK